MGIKVVNYMSEREDTRDSWLAEDLKRKRVGLYKIYSSSLCEGGFSYHLKLFSLTLEFRGTSILGLPRFSDLCFFLFCAQVPVLRGEPIPLPLV